MDGGVGEAARPWGARRPTREDVRACYLYILGREPESEAVLDRHLAQAATIRDLRRRFIASEEFGADGVAPVPAPAALHAPPLPVETEASPTDLARMLERTGGYWARIGEEEPFWSVLTQDRFRTARIAANAEAFYASGAEDAEVVRRALERAGVAPADMPLCVEFGCGTGRATLHLARLFPRVVGCDISPAHLALAREEAEKRRLGNLLWHRSTVEAPMPPGLRWNVWFSRIVLQHNPPPVMAHLLRQAWAGLAPGGLAVFQVPTYSRGYRFSVREYLDHARPEAEMEMHVLPQPAIFALAREAGLEPLEVRDDACVLANPAASISNLFVLRRPG